MPALAQVRSRSVIEEIIVTAQKRATALQDTPISLSALDGEMLDQRGIETIGELQHGVPNLTVTEALSGSTLVSIRGVGMNFDSGGSDPTVAIHVDGVYQPRTTTPLIGLRDAERVEVLRGPQGTLYGRNATGGAVNFILARPTEELEGKIQAGYSSFDTRDVSGVLSGPLIPGLLLGRVYAEYGDSDGFIENLTLGRTIGGRRSYGGTLGLRFLPLDNLTADLSLQHQKDTWNGPDLTLIAPPDPVLEARTTIFPPTTSDPDCCGPTGFYESLAPIDPIFVTKTTNAALTIDWDLGFASIKSISGFQNHDLFDIHNAGAVRREIASIKPRQDDARTYSEELNVSGSFAGWFESHVDWLVGGFYFRDDPYRSVFDIDFPAAAAGTGLRILFDGEQITEAFAGFGDATISLTPGIRVFGGLRYSLDRKDVLQDIIFFKEGVRLPDNPPATCSGVKVSRTFDDLSPRVGLQWQVSDSLPMMVFDDLMLYAHRQQGYTAGGINLTACNNPFDPADVTSHEIGFKSTLLDGRLTANFAIFDNDYRNFQVFKVTGLSSLVVNAPKASITGAELELRAQPFADWLGPLANVSFDAAGSWLDAVYDEFRDTDNTNPDAGEQDLSGNELNGAPDYTINLGGGYDGTTPFLDWGRLRLRGEWYRTAAIRFRPYGQPDDRQDPYSLLNAYLSLANESESLELRFFAKNLTETRYFVLKFAQAWAERFGRTGPPRSFGTSLTFRF